MDFIRTTAVEKIVKLRKRLRVIQGGSSAGKTVAILLILIERCQAEKNLLVSVVSESFPHLRRGSVRDFLNIMETQELYRDNSWNKSEMIYQFDSGSKIEFFSADQPGKVRGPRRTDLFLNECNNISFEVYTQLAIRTTGSIYLDYNPVSSFWVQEEVIPKQEHDFLILTYKDNEGLAPSIVQEIESRRNRKGWWEVYGLGQLGEVEGKIYNNWAIIDEIPHEARLERYGLDFGYTNDPTAIVAIYYYNGGYILDEITFQKGLSNKQIADILINQPKALTIADSAEPKSIDEIRSFGVNIQPTTKGKDSVKHGIQLVQEQKISYTKRSFNLHKAYMNYLWQVDKDGRIINEPDHLFSDLMDGIRYGINSLIPVIRRKEFLQGLRQAPPKPKQQVAL